jgi:hypothetical protein
MDSERLEDVEPLDERFKLCQVAVRHNESLQGLLIVLYRIRVTHE